MYRETAPDEDLIAVEWVRIPLHARELPGYKTPRIACAMCGEGISYDREVVDEELVEGEVVRRVLCRGCADVKGRYYQPL